LRENAEEAQALLADLLISVTTFFRDPKAFDVLAKRVMPKLFEGKDADSVVRVWIPGCATGEEAYTISMLLLEQAAKQDVRPEIQVFASDMDTGALSIAREGRYPEAIETDVSEERLRRFFAREGDHYRVKRDLRDVVLFAHHSLLKDPPFSKLDLVSCRNLLIYLDRDLQAQVLNTLHYALIPDGYLLLGTSETAEHPHSLFRPVDRDMRIYQSVAGTGDRYTGLPHLTRVPAAEYVPLARERVRAAGPTDALLHRQALEKIAPPSILVDETHRAVHLSETAGRYLQPSGGPLTGDVTDLVRQELRFDLRSALHRAFERAETTLSPPIPVKFNGFAHRMYFQVRPVAVGQGDSPPRHALIIFIEGEAVDSSLVGVTPAPEEGRGAIETIRRLEQELQLAESRLRTTREESEAANEELRAANEELQSINEEYRSTSEELETSKEELQSINEELQTVNSELKLKLESISRAHSDLQNLMAATDFGTLFLDTTLRIKRFTPRLIDIFNITTSDEGRPITDFTHRLEYERLAEDARTVLRDLTPIEREVQSRNGGWYLVRMRPYRTVDDKIDGVVATFVDMTERRRIEDALRSSEARLRHETRLVEVSRAPIFVWDLDGSIVDWNRGSEQLYGFSKKEAVGQKKNALLKTHVPGSSWEALEKELIKKGAWSGELQQVTKDGRTILVESQIELVPMDGHRLVLESTRDVTERKAWDRRQQLLLSELAHRVKNTLAVVQSIAGQTLRTSPSNEEFVDRFNGRIDALARAHGLLLESHWSGTDIGLLVRGQLEPYTAEGPDRIRINGPKVILKADQAIPFGLMLHELATNAAKYGALSDSGGHVELNWSLAERNRKPILTVVWQEKDGPPVKEPKGKGFGTRLIAKGLPGAKVQHEYRKNGVVCTIEIPLPVGQADE
jgi:two-component system CheB/CheR fusion protein